jgi:hypothetical protein
MDGGGDGGGGHGGGDSGGHGGGGHHGGDFGGHHHHHGGAGGFTPIHSPGGPRRGGRRAFVIVWLVGFFGILSILTVLALSH